MKKIINRVISITLVAAICFGLLLGYNTYADVSSISKVSANEADNIQKTITNAVPEDKELSHKIEDGLSWTAAEGAVSHNVYFGEDETAVESATLDSEEFKDTISETKFSLDNIAIEHMKIYYWRVDEVFEDGTVEKGNVYSFRRARLAFPTAEGYGRYANGGRGGRVIKVTNLNDSGEGSLRWALEEETGPRIVVFDIGGIIRLESAISIDSNHGDVYVAGQTAPGDGITLINYPITGYRAEDIVIRNIRFRIGDSGGSAMDGMTLRYCDNSIIDHCSSSWAIGYGFLSMGSENITLQNSIIAESLYDSLARDEWGKVKSSYATLIGGEKASYHHNLLINNAENNWAMGYHTDENATDYNSMFIGKADIRNNVVYNWHDGTGYGDLANVHFVNNYYKKGAASEEDNIFTLKRYSHTATVDQKVYMSGNKMIDYDGNTLLDSDNDDPWKLVTSKLENYAIEDAKSMEPFFESYINTETADEAYETVASNVGANAPKRDYIDSRYIDELVNNKSTYTGSKSGLAGIIDSQNDVGGYPNETNFKGGEAPLDTDYDGMPDEWEINHGLNPENYYDACQVYLSDEGYTNIELYINELAGDPVVYSDNPKLQYTPATPTPEPTATPEPTPTETATPEPIVTPTPEPIQVVLGDINGDELVNASDALLVLKHAAKIETLTDEALLSADITEDESVDAEDALAILRIAAKIE